LTNVFLTEQDTVATVPPNSCHFDSSFASFSISHTWLVLTDSLVINAQT